jgi:EpsI family protein
MTGLVSRHLGVLLSVVAVTGLLLAWPRAEQQTRRIALAALPETLGDWRSVEGKTDDVLPQEPRALDTVRRTYSDGRMIAWLAVGLYSSHNDPQGRPSVNQIASERGAGIVTHDWVRVALDGNAEGERSIHRISLGRSDGRVSTVYWYQLGETLVTGEYELRWRLFLDTIAGRRRRLLLIRLATTGPEPPEALLRAVSQHLRNASP